MHLDLPGPAWAAELAVTAPPQRPGKGREGSTPMLVLKYLLIILGIRLFGSASALVVYDIYLSAQLRRLLRRDSTDESGADLRARAPRNPLRNGFTLSANFPGATAGQGLR
jgi:hypothetical protein